MSSSSSRWVFHKHWLTDTTKTTDATNQINRILLLSPSMRIEAFAASFLSCGVLLWSFRVDCWTVSLFYATQTQRERESSKSCPRVSADSSCSCSSSYCGSPSSSEFPLVLRKEPFLWSCYIYLIAGNFSRRMHFRVCLCERISENCQAERENWIEISECWERERERGIEISEFFVLFFWSRLRCLDLQQTR